ncbi:MAG: hypothetical protein U9N56_02570 [Actinomycetota bacterium]|nr:hypothetical protein [Actinomycetota bacterium]
MSLFSTIAHDGAAPTRGFSPKAIGMMVAALALGVALGFVIGNSRTAAESSATAVAPATGLALDDFVRLNTTDLGNWVPAASAAAIESQAVIDPFIQMNTTDLDALVAAASATVIGSQAGVNPDFLSLNTTSYDGLVPAASANGQTSGTVSEEFLDWNIASLEYSAARYSEQSSGPR